LASSDADSFSIFNVTITGREKWKRDDRLRFAKKWASHDRSYQSSEVLCQKLHLVVSEVRQQGTTDCLPVRKAAINALVASFHYRLHLVLFHSGESADPHLRHRRRDDQLVVQSLFRLR
jgi:hypothetical protein